MLTWKVGGGGARGVMLAHGLIYSHNYHTCQEKHRKTKYKMRHICNGDHQMCKITYIDTYYR